MNRNEIATATRNALVIFLKAEGAYQGAIINDDGVRASRAPIALLRDYALTVWDAANEPAKVDVPSESAELIATLEVDVPVEPKAPAKPTDADKVAARRARKHARQDAARAKKDALLQAAIEAAMKRTKGKAENTDDGSVAIAPVDLQAAGYSKAFWMNRAPWSPTHSAGAGKAAARAGFRALTRKDMTQDGGFFVLLVPSADPLARPDRSQSASRAAARARKVSDKMVAKFQAVIAVAAKEADGSIVLPAESLAMGGIGANWARTTAAHLNDATHVKARTLLACGYTGHCQSDTLVLTPVAATTDVAETAA